MLKMLELFAGVAGATLAAERFGIKTTQFVEIDPVAQKVLRQYFPQIPIHNDICTYEPTFSEADIIWVSFPCKGSSNAGKRTGLNHPETGLWWEAWRIIQAVRPRFAIVEQPDGIRYRGLSEILRCFAKSGYMGEWETVPASVLGAAHLRERVFVIAHADDLLKREWKNWGGWEKHIREEVEAAFANGIGCDGDCSFPERKSPGLGVDDGISPELVRGCSDVPDWLSGISYGGWWASNPPPQRAAIKGKKIPDRRDCIRLYGNAVTPQQAAVVFRRVLEIASQ